MAVPLIAAVVAIAAGVSAQDLFDTTSEPTVVMRQLKVRRLTESNMTEADVCDGRSDGSYCRGYTRVVQCQGQRTNSLRRCDFWNVGEKCLSGRSTTGEPEAACVDLTCGGKRDGLYCGPGNPWERYTSVVRCVNSSGTEVDRCSILGCDGSVHGQAYCSCAGMSFDGWYCVSGSARLIQCQGGMETGSRSCNETEVCRGQGWRHISEHVAGCVAASRGPE